MQKLTFIGLMLIILSCNSPQEGVTGNEKTTNPEIADNTGLSGDSTAVRRVDSTPSQPYISASENDTKPKHNLELIEIEQITPEPKNEDIPVHTASISFESQIHEFGRVTEGEIIEHTFYFTNTGKAPLIIKDALSDCGCTVPEYSKEPVMPAASGSVKISFDTKGRLGVQEKLVTVVTNGDPISQILRVKGTVGTD